MSENVCPLTGMAFARLSLLFAVACASKPLLVRSDFDTKSDKLGEIAPGTLVFGACAAIELSTLACRSRHDA